MCNLRQYSKDTVLFYIPENSVLDNFAATGITYKGEYWPTAEHAYQASKFTHETIRRRIREATSPHMAKDLAHESCYRQYLYENWRHSKVSEMCEILTAKMVQHEVVKRVLLATGNVLLVEDSQEDNFWGGGEAGNGLNMVGRIWMAIRSMYQASSGVINVDHLEALAEAWLQGVKPVDDGRCAVLSLY